MSRRGYLMPLVLLLVTVLFVMGTGFLSSHNTSYEAAVGSIEQVQARALAYAGVEDARSKLARDRNFPPIGDLDQFFFTYTEPLTDVNSGRRLGTYTVSVDVSRAGGPAHVIQVVSTGRTNRNSPYTIRVEFDNSLSNRNDASLSNPHKLTILNWSEEGLGL